MAEAPVDVAEDEPVSVERAIAALEAQRGVLGDAVVDTALGPLRRRLDELRSGVEQRRLVTVLFADLVDFTSLSERLDAEDVRTIVDRYFARWSRTVAAHGGEVEKFIGDAVMAVFGLRRSYEDDAHRAVRSALSVLTDLDVLNAQLAEEFGVRLAARVGVDTGDVVVSTLGDRDAGFVAVGPTVNRAARLQAAAPPGGVLVSAETRRLVRGAFGMEERPGLRLKGVEEPVDAALVLTELGSGFRLERAAPVEGVVTETVGRAWQLQSLQHRLDEVGEERLFRVVTVVGDAGIGKTRLLFDFDAWLLERPQAVWWFRGRASPATRGTVGALLRDVLSARLGIRLDDDRERVRQRFGDAFGAALGRTEGSEAARLVAAWLGYDAPAGDVPTDPQALRDRGTAALARYFAALAEQVPVVLLLEDLHWADDESLRWIDAAAPLLGDRAMLVVASTRPALFESRPRWGEGLDHHLRLELSPLTRRESRGLLRQLLALVDAPPPALVDLVLDAGEGNPFYLEELIGWLVDVGVIVKEEPRWRVEEARVGELAVPPTLRGVLQSRLDALDGRERAALHRASVIGRVFWDTAVDSLDARAAAAALDGLRGRDVVLQREVSRFSGAREFVFKHALLRDVAYDTVLRRTRERYHRAAAGWLEETAARVGRTDEYAAVIADHLERARDPLAAGWYLRAAGRASAVYALAEARELLDGADRAVGRADASTRFDIALAREALLDRAGDREAQAAVLDLLDRLAPQVDDERRVRRLLARAGWTFQHSEYDATLALAAEAEDLARVAGRPDLEAAAILLRGQARTWLDDVDEAQVLLLRAAEVSAAAGRPAIAAESRRYLSMLSGNRGDFADSLEQGRAARAMYAAIGDAEMEAMALAQTGTTYYRMGRYRDAQAALEESLPIFRRAGHRYREVMVTANLASVAVMRGDLAAAVRFGSEAVPAQRELGDPEAMAVTLITLGTAHLFTGDIGSARRELDEGVSIARAAGNATLEADALVRSSHLSLVAGDADEALRVAGDAVRIGADVVSALDRAATRLTLGHALLAARREEEARAAYREAEEAFGRLDLYGPGREATAGAAAARCRTGDPEGAAAELTPILDHLTVEGLSGAFVPGVLLQQAVGVLERAGDPRAGAARDAARAYLRTAAAEIGDPAMAAGYLALPPHAALLAD